jgi:hypothetical protein
MLLSDPLVLAYIAAAYLLGSTVKGVTGFGALLVAVPLMSLAMDPAVAVELTGGPVLVSNIWQVIDSRHLTWAARRFWPLLVTLVPSAFIGSQFLALTDSRFTSAAIGIMVLLFCLTWVLPVKIEIPPDKERLGAPLAGAISGLVGGATILSGSVVIMYLVALKLTKDQFVGTIALIYLGTSIPIYLTLTWFGRIGTADMAVSAGLIVPAILGMVLGRMIRNRVSQKLFQNLVMVLLTAVGVLLVTRAF